MYINVRKYIKEHKVCLTQHNKSKIMLRMHTEIF